ncbi:YbaB/EbfC family nucleoid-associated protein [Actinoplanes teichomyceticus]|uniref:YbaB/EbfC DNA-binding family protein n=1 Tax=Actinoplanes teichomyceticus TaxID=1867 RepID=A0A561WK30_ACTTI|nr:YbaB/EbfC family nucleoid-associated protein [Actinoplanes teichomyceticus]TWG24183.1 hypothetical protein FHX34_102736 [Actinoplanes teichomyceticus]GIF12970.1 hypothetical protein Ate01nite_30020 [Actinoplanes teichomyceticus]
MHDFAYRKPAAGGWARDLDHREPVAGEAADGRVRVALDGDGRLVELHLDPRVAYLPLDELRRALIDAFTAAWDRRAGRDGDVAARYGAGVAPDRLRASLAEASETAERRFAEVCTALSDLNRRAARPW